MLSAFAKSASIMVKFEIRGLLPPVVTPFNNDLSLNLKAIEPYADYLVSQNIKGLVVNGSTGEGTSMNVVERKAVAEAWINAGAKRNLHVMVQVGGAPLPDVFELASHAASMKADSIMTLPDLYIKPKTVDDLVDYLEMVANEAPNTPLLYYNIPAQSGVTIHMPSMMKSAKQRIPSFAGIKFTSLDLNEGYDCLKVADGELAVFLGADQVLAGSTLLGFDSSIGSTFNMLPHGQRILDLMAKEEVRKAREVQSELNDVLNEITEKEAWIPLMKALMPLLTPIDAGPVRPPMRNISSDHIIRIRNILTKRALLKE